MPDLLGSDQARYTGKRVLVVGFGHSAIGALIDLNDPPADQRANANRRRECQPLGPQQR
jgi:hypothetical protein